MDQSALKQLVMKSTFYYSYQGTKTKTSLVSGKINLKNN